jgi:hypothetical protein
MQDNTPLVRVAQDRFGSRGWSVTTSENGFQGWVVISGVRRREADRIANALCPALKRLVLARFDAETRESLTAFRKSGRPVEQREEYEQYRAGRREAVLKRLVISRP